MQSLTSQRGASCGLRSACATPVARRTTVLVHAKAAAVKEKRIKRAPSAFNLFTKEKFGPIKEGLVSKAQPASIIDVMPLLRKSWEALPEKEKAHYAKQSDNLREVVAKARAEAEAAKGPKKPINAWQRYMIERLPQERAKTPGASLTDSVKVISAEWKSLSDARKQPYQDSYQKDLATYQKYKADNPVVKAAPPVKAKVPAAKASAKTAPAAAAPKAAAPKAAAPAPPAKPAAAPVHAPVRSGSAAPRPVAAAPPRSITPASRAVSPRK